MPNKQKINLHQNVHFKLTKIGKKALNIYLEKIAKGKPKEDMQHVRECLSPDSDGYYYMHLNDLFIIFGQKLSEGVIIFQEKEFYLGL